MKSIAHPSRRTRLRLTLVFLLLVPQLGLAAYVCATTDMPTSDATVVAHCHDMSIGHAMQASSLCTRHCAQQSVSTQSEMGAAADATVAKIKSAGALDGLAMSYIVAPNTAGGPCHGLNQKVQISQPIPWPGALDIGIRAARADAQSADGQVDNVRLRRAAAI